MIVIKSIESIISLNIGLSYLEHKIANYIIVETTNKIQQENEYVTIETNCQELAKIIGYNMDSYIGGKSYKDIKNSLKKLLSYNIFSLLDIDNSNIIKIRLNKIYIPDLSNEKSYITFDYSYLLMMQSKYTVRLYELAKIYEKKEHNNFEINIQDLKNFLFCPNSYENFATFRLRVLDKSIEKINEYTDINLSYQTEHVRKKVNKIIFKINKFKFDYEQTSLLYEYLKKKLEKTKIILFDFYRLSNIIHIDKNSYIKMFIEKIIINEINEKTDLYIKYEPVFLFNRLVGYIIYSMK